MKDLHHPVVMLGLWLAGGLVALCGALSYGELGAAFPQAGGEYAFLSRLYHPVLGFLSGWVSFFVGFSAPIAASAIGFSEYLTRALPGLLRPGIIGGPAEAGIMKKLFAIMIIAADALKVYDKLIRAGQATAHTWCGAGDVLTTIGEYAQAGGAFESSLQLEPQNPEARNNLGRVRYRLGDMDAAVRDLRAAADQSDALVSWLNLAIAMPGAPSADHQQVLDCRREFARRLADVAGDTADARPVRRRGSSSPVRVGYVSEFFHRPNYMKPVWALLNHHDRQSFEIHLFSDSPGGPVGRQLARCNRRSVDFLKNSMAWRSGVCNINSMNPATNPALPTLSDTRTDKPIRYGRATLTFDQGSLTYFVSAPGYAPRSTRSFSRALNLVVGLA